MNDKTRVLIGSPVHQKRPFYANFLISLHRLRQEHMEFGYLFIDDNRDERASEMLRDFAKVVDHVTVLTSGQGDEYFRNETTHFWTEHLIGK